MSKRVQRLGVRLPTLAVALLALTACAEETSGLCPEACTESVFEGDVEVDGTNDLSQLEGYTRITGQVTIKFNDTLTGLGDLACLRTVDGDLRIRDNDNLENLDGLGCLTASGGLQVSDNASLTSLRGLGNLAAVGSDVWIVDNDSLTNVDGLEGLTQTEHDLTVTGEAMTDLSGLRNVVSVGNSLWLESTGLADFADLAGLEAIGGSLIVDGNDALTSVQSMKSIADLGGSLEIYENYALPTCEAWELYDHFVELGLDPYEIICGNLEDECEWEACQYGG